MQISPPLLAHRAQICRKLGIQRWPFRSVAKLVHQQDADGLSGLLPLADASPLQARFSPPQAVVQQGLPPMGAFAFAAASPGKLTLPPLLGGSKTSSSNSESEQQQQHQHQHQLAALRHLQQQQGQQQQGQQQQGQQRQQQLAAVDHLHQLATLHQLQRQHQDSHQQPRSSPGEAREQQLSDIVQALLPLQSSQQAAGPVVAQHEETNIGSVLKQLISVRQQQEAVAAQEQHMLLVTLAQTVGTLVHQLVQQQQPGATQVLRGMGSPAAGSDLGGGMQPAAAAPPPDSATRLLQQLHSRLAAEQATQPGATSSLADQLQADLRKVLTRPQADMLLPDLAAALAPQHQALVLPPQLSATAPAAAPAAVPAAAPVAAQQPKQHALLEWLQKLAAGEEAAARQPQPLQLGPQRGHSQPLPVAEEAWMQPMHSQPLPPSQSIMHSPRAPLMRGVRPQPLAASPSEVKHERSESATATMDARMLLAALACLGSEDHSTGGGSSDMDATTTGPKLQDCT